MTLTNKQPSGTQANTIYYYVVFVKYAAGNVAHYTSGYQTSGTDSTPPSITIISIDSGSSHTNSTVTLSFSALSASKIYISNTSECASGGSWETYNTVKLSWILLGQLNATAIVCVTLWDVSGNESACINDDIVHDSTGSTATSMNTDWNTTDTTLSSVTLTLIKQILVICICLII